MQAVMVNSQNRIYAPTSNRIFAPTVTGYLPPPVPVVRQNPDEGLAGFIAGVLSALVVGASLLAKGRGSEKRR